MGKRKTEGMELGLKRELGPAAKGKKKQLGKKKRTERLGLDLLLDRFSVWASLLGPVYFFPLLLVQTSMHFFQFFSIFFNPYKINKTNIKILN